MEVKDIIRKVKQIEIRTRRKTQAALMGQYHSAFKGQGMTFAEVRQYQYGDEIRMIDWNKTARFREPYVKVMEEDRELTVMLLVDISASMNYGTHDNLKREYVAEICASIGFTAAGNNDKVGLILFADKVYKVIPPKKGRKHVLTLISTILTEEYIPTPTQVKAPLQYLMNVFKRKTFVFLFSDFEEEPEERTFRAVAKKHEVLAIRVADEKDNEIPNIGYCLLQDVESGNMTWVNTSSARWRYTFAEEQKQKVKHLKEEMENASAGFLNLKTNDDYAKQILQYFQTKR